jgi:hypothetical protein
MTGRTGRARWAAAAVLGVVGWCGTAAAQQPAAPTRLVVQPGGQPGVYTVTGAAPAAAPANPVVPAAGAARPVNPPALVNAPSPYPVAAAPAAIEPGCPSGTCAAGQCKHGPRVGHSALNGVTFGQCLSFNWHCFCTPATVPPPLGANVRSVFEMQKLNALGEYFVLFREDWLAGTSTLNSTGERHFDGIVRRLGMTGAPVRVEPTGNPELDTVRRLAVVEALVRNGIPEPEAQARVVIGGTRAEGLRYSDIETVYMRSRIIGIGGYGGGGGVGGVVGGFGGY